jgi:hypothetical protein
MGRLRPEPGKTKEDVRMNPSRIFLVSAFCASALFLLNPAGASSTFTDTFGWNAEQIELVTVGGLRAVGAEGCVLEPDPGGLLLPAMTVQYNVAPDVRVKSVRVIGEEWTGMGRGFEVDDWSEAAALWGADRPFAAALREAPRRYGDPSWYPGEIIEYAGGGYLRGRRVEGFIVKPVRYRAGTGELEYLSRVEVEIDLEGFIGNRVEVNRVIEEAERSIDGMLGRVMRRGKESGYVERMERRGAVVESGSNEAGGFMPSSVPGVNGSAVEYVIVTGREMEAEFDRLAEWKTAKGVKAALRTVEWIESNYAGGSDLAETIRLFLKDAYANWGTVYVLLGGDTGVVPVRYGLSRYYNQEGDAIPTDIYYSCLDGDWNADKDDKWGEGMSVLHPGDFADLYPEVFVGRAPVDTPEEARVFVDKIITYEKDPPVGYQNKALFFAEVLFPQPWNGQSKPFLDGADIAETAASTLPSHFEIVRLYENHTNPDYPDALPLNRASAMEELSEGYGIAHHVGHGYRTTMAVGTETLHSPDVNSLTNGERASVVCALNCDAAAVDYNAIAETFLLNPNGGGVSYIGATRFDFPTTTWGYQDEFYKLVFVHGVARIGQAFAWSRLLHVPVSRKDNVSRWTQFGHILLGDPEMPIWTDSPSDLDVSMPAELAPGAQQLSVAVGAAGDGSPVVDARVACMKDGEVFAVGRTDESGMAVLEISPGTPGPMSVTVTGRDVLAEQLQVNIVSSSDHNLYVVGFSVDDDPGAGGDGDGLPEPGETIELTFTVGNNGGTRSPEGLGSLIVEDDGLIEVLLGSVEVPAIDPGGSTAVPPFLVRVSDSVPDGRRVGGRASFAAGGSGSYRDFALEIGAPHPEVHSTLIDDAAGGDGDGVAEPGESVDVAVSVINTGGGSAVSTYALLDVVRGDATVLSDSVHYGDVESGAVATGGSFGVLMGSDPEPAFMITLADARGLFHSHALDLIPPAAPDGLSGSGTEGTVRLGWSPAEENDVMGYVVYRSTVQGGPYTSLTGFVVRGASAYEDRHLTALTRYFYVVAARDSSGNESGLSAEVGVSSPPPRLPGWPVETDVESAAGVVIGDLDGDGDLEIVGAGGEIYAFHHDGEEVVDGDGKVITHGVFSSVAENPSKGFWSTPAVADLDGDGISEVIASYWDGQKTYVWNGADGSVKSGWPQASSDFIWSSPAVGDIDGDGDWEVVSGGGDGEIYAWEADGTEVADGDGDPATVGVLVAHGSNFSYGSTALADLDGDGADEVIAGLRNGTLIVVRGDGTDYEGFPQGAGPSVVSTPSVVDLDNDGEPEIVVSVGSNSNSTNSSLRVFGFNPDFGLEWRQFVKINQDFNSSPAIGDIDGDSVLDVVLGTADQEVYAWRGTDGSLLEGWPVETGATVRGSAALADIDGDGYPDVLIGDELAQLHCFNYKGEALPGFPLKASAAIRSAPVVWDVNGDGLVDILCQAMDKRIYAWTYQGVFDPSRVSTPWPMFFHDPRHTSLFTTEMPFPTRLASWDLSSGEEGVTMSWRLVDRNGEGSWRVHRRSGAASVVATDESLASGRYEGKRPEFLSDFTDVTDLGFLSPDAGPSVFFRDPAPGSGVVTYVLEFVAQDGPSRFFGPRSVESPGLPAGRGAMLLSVAPNPFRTRTEFVLLIPEAGAAPDPVSLRVFDAAGRTVSSLSWKGLTAGAHRLRWEGRNGSGERLPAGVYFYKLTAGDLAAAGKLLLVR